MAQLENGLPQLIHQLHQVISGTQAENSQSKGHRISAGLRAIFAGGYDHTSNSGEKQIDADSTMNQRAIDTIYSDYAVNIINKRLDSEQLLKEDCNEPTGSFVCVTSEFSLYDFEHASNILSLNNPIFNDLVDEDSDDDDALLKSAISFNKMFPDMSILKIENGAVFLENKNFRMNPAQRIMITHRTSKITVLGIVEKVINKYDLDDEEDDADNQDDKKADTTGEQETESDDGENFAEYASHFPLSMLGSFDMIKENDRLIKPIAVYFE